MTDKAIDFSSWNARATERLAIAHVRYSGSRHHAASRAALRSDSIDIWTWSLSPPLHTLDSLLRVLSDDERARAGRFAAPLHAGRFAAGRGRMREILGLYLRKAPAGISFLYNAFGKPQLGHGSGLHFNLSHSGDTAVLAVSHCFDLGVDIEEIKPVEEELAARFFSKAESDALRAIPESRSVNAFYRCWTSKEAFVKAHGAGLSLPLDSFDVDVDPDSPPALLSLGGDREAARQWSMLAIDLPDGYCGTVAALTVGNRVALRYRDLGEISGQTLPAFRD